VSGSPTEYKEDEETGLTSSISTLYIVVLPEYFNNGVMVVRCVAKVGPVLSTVRIQPTMQHHKETSLLVQARGSSSTPFNKGRILSVFVVAVAISYR